MMTYLRFAIVSLVLLVLGREARSAEKQAADFLPATTIAYGEITRPKQLVGTLLDHPLRGQWEELPEVKKAIQTPQFQEFVKVVTAVEKQTGVDYRTLVESLSEGGISVAFDGLLQGVVALVKARDAATLEKHLVSLVDLARDEARRRGAADPIPTSDYQGKKVYRAGEARWMAVGEWLVISNKQPLLERVARSIAGSGAESLAGQEDFQAATKTKDAEATAWFYVNVAVLRSVGVAKELFAPRNDNPPGELLLGGVASSLEKTPYVTGAIFAQTNRVAVSFAMPHEADWIPARREFYFGAGGKGAAGAMLTPQQTLLSIATYRDAGRFWLLKEDLFTENVIAQMTQADSNLTTLFSGRDFGREILGSLRPEIQLVVARQTFEGRELPAPDIKLPAGALVLRLKDPDQMQRPLKVLFQSLVGFLNVAGAQNGQPPLEQETQKLPQGILVAARYLPDGKEGRINYNFSPSVAFVNDYFIVSSAETLAKELAGLADDAKPAANESATENTRGRLNVPVLRDVLRDNQKHLVAQTALNDGLSKEVAEQNVDRLLSLMAYGKSLGLRLAIEQSQLKLQLEVTIDSSAAK